jgi:ABC-type sugar transport system ATPase subunit
MLTATNLSMSYGHVQALSGTSLQVAAGEVLAIVGDNGAGKSTIVKILSGLLSPDSGTVEMDGAVLSLPGVDQVQKHGISTVFQDLALIEPLDVAANLYVGREPTWGFFVRRKVMIAEATRRLAEIGIRLPSVKTPVGLLSGGQRQALAIARAVMHGGKLIIMDEPTAALGVRETARVEDIITGLSKSGVAIVLVSHDLEMVFRLSHRIQVQRLGRCVGVLETATTSRDEVVSYITGSRTAKIEDDE